MGLWLQSYMLYFLMLTNVFLSQLKWHGATFLMSCTVKRYLLYIWIKKLVEQKPEVVLSGDRSLCNLNILVSRSGWEPVWCQVKFKWSLVATWFADVASPLWLFKSTVSLFLWSLHDVSVLLHWKMNFPFGNIILCCVCTICFSHYPPTMRKQIHSTEAFVREKSNSDF